MLTRLMAVVVLGAALIGAARQELRANAARPSLNMSQRAGTGADTAQAALAAEVDLIGAQRPAAEARDLTRLYERTGGRPAWLSADGRPGMSAREAIAMLAGAAAEALDPGDYGLPDLATGLAALSNAPPEVAARFDVRLSDAVLRYYRHLHLGRANPRALGLELGLPADSHDFADLLHAAIASGRVAGTAGTLMPVVTQYGLLRQQLEHYRRLAASGAAGPTFSVAVRPGDAFDDVEALRRLLVTVGDLSAGTALPDGVYDETIAAGVRRFQLRHGLEVDGIIGRATQAAMAVPLAWRVRQLELALERLRWLPDLGGGRVIVVNIPMFRLWAWNHLPSREGPVLSMKVVVGQALDTQTPVFARPLEYLVFRPYWNVPSSILQNEMLPAIRRNPRYLDQQNLEIVRGPGDDAAVLAATPQHVAELGRNGVRLRQRPGPGNALGLVKFIFPNSDAVYMHDTPARQVFSRSRRDVSHGCIRVEDPMALAEWALADLPGWSRERIRAAANGAPNQRVDLPEPIQVVLFYTTVLVEPEDGSVLFADDIYGHDRALNMAL
jgi:murein L,D-transpeptidase YcbB/YkuD